MFNKRDTLVVRCLLDEVEEPKRGEPARATSIASTTNWLFA